MKSPHPLSRRAFLRGSAAALAFPSLALRPTDAWALAEPASPFVKRVVKTPEKSYFTYPHSQGFLPNGSAVLARPGEGASSVEYFTFDFAGNGTPVTLNKIRDARMYFAVSDGGLLAFTKKNSVSVFDATKPDSKPREVYANPPWVFHSDCDISADGKSLLVTITKPDEPQLHRVVMIDVESGREEVLIEEGWLLDHAHFSPFDPKWVCYCNAVPKDYKRTWVWHRQNAPKGKQLFNQVQPDGKVFDLGHERAMFHKPALLTIAYGSSSNARPCGLYELGFDGSSRLVSESMRDFHCNISRDGKWAVVSLQGTFEILQQRIAAGWLDKATGFGPSDVMIVNMRTGAREFLFRSYNDAIGQPYEVQPSISPDGKWVTMKNGREKCVVAVELDQAKLSSFLR